MHIQVALTASPFRVACTEAWILSNFLLCDGFAQGIGGLGLLALWTNDMNGNMKHTWVAKDAKIGTHWNFQRVFDIFIMRFHRFTS
jgi:hypothetical protein